MNDLMDLTGQVALVVGVGGIVHAQVLGLAANGADIVAADRDLERARATAKAARAGGRQALTVGRVMIQQGRGKIINLSSVRGRFGAPRGCAAYCASKGAVDSLTRTLACEWAQHNVLVNALAPTVEETEFTKAILETQEGPKD